MTIWHMRIACLIPKATDTHSQYVIFIARPLHQWLHESSGVPSNFVAGGSTNSVEDKG